ncbi:MAG: HAD family hydrolase [Hyphomicrobiaceae bacterium]
MTFKAIIWDCDGVLIDSEVLACRIAAEFYTRAGYPLSMIDFARRFAGQSKLQIADIIRQETGKDLASRIDWTQEDAAREALFETELQTVPGVRDFLSHASFRDIPMAIASGSSLKRLEHALKLVDLWNRFHPHIYSSEIVHRGKPSPDIFLYAAAQMAIAPHDCLVIEDAAHGVQAGKAAGMTVIGFTGARHCTAEWPELLRNAGADEVYGSMDDLSAGTGGGDVMTDTGPGRQAVQGQFGRARAFRKQGRRRSNFLRRLPVSPWRVIRNGAISPSP